jgi:hypothetical protein
MVLDLEIKTMVSVLNKLLNFPIPIIGNTVQQKSILQGRKKPARVMAKELLYFFP